MRRERRRAPRVALAIEIIVRCGGQTLACRAADISATGMLLFPPQPLGGGHLSARLRVPGQSQWLDANAVFVRDAVETRTPYACAVEFLMLPARTEAALKRFTVTRASELPPVEPRALARLYREALAAVDASDGL